MPDLLPVTAADKYVPDSVQAARSGKLHHALQANVFGVDKVYGELGALASGQLPALTCRYVLPARRCRPLLPTAAPA